MMWQSKVDSIENLDCLGWISTVSVPGISDKFLQDPDEALILTIPLRSL